MSTNNDRVINRLGARELSQEETETIFGTGDKLNTFASQTGTAHGDCDFDQ